MNQKRTPQQEVDALRVVVIRQREVLNRKSAELEKYKTLCESASKHTENMLSKVLEMSKIAEEQSKKCKEFALTTRVAVFFMLNAIREGYKFPNADAERVFYEFCDGVGINEADRKACFADETEASK